MLTSSRWPAALVVALLLAAAEAPAAAAARPLALGFFDPVYYAAPAERDPWLQRTVDAGSDVVRVQIGWVARGTARRPANFDARNPADPNYDFALADASIKAASARGLRVLASFTSAPPWAEGPNRPSSAFRGSWRPDPQAVGDYAVALARRYSGTFADPSSPGATLPRVPAFQLWNEPNLAKYLTPQWSRGRTAAPAHYRRMLRAFYAGIKSVRRDALVVTAGTAPFGDPQPGGLRIMPARFVRDLLCVRRLSRGRLGRTSCPAPARFDVLAHHPYSVGAPRRRALNDDDVSIPDIDKLSRVLRFAERSGRALPRKRHRLWVTEVSYDSSPPDPDGVPVARHARFLEEALYLLWRQGVDTITWLRIFDEAPLPSFGATNQSGIFFADGTAKPAATAFRFPFVVERATKRSLTAWGRSPVAGRVTIERRGRDGTWRALRTVVAGRHGTFLLRIPAAAAPGRLRARIGDEQSLIWTLRSR